MTLKTAQWLLTIGLAIPMMTAGQPALGVEVEQAGQPNPGSTNTAYRLEINFATGSAEVSPAFDKEIRRVTDYLKNYPHATCDVRGYTDNVGEDALNLKISQERAANVRKYMIDTLGVMAYRVTAHGYGKADPIASNDTEEGRRLNRRIIALVSK